MSHMGMSRVTLMNESCHTWEYLMFHMGMSVVTHTRMSHVSHGRVMSLIRLSHVTHMNESCHSYE